MAAPLPALTDTTPRVAWTLRPPSLALGTEAGLPTHEAAVALLGRPPSPLQGPGRPASALEGAPLLSGPL